MRTSLHLGLRQQNLRQFASAHAAILRLPSELEDIKCGHGITEWRCAQHLSQTTGMAFQPAHPGTKCIPSGS